MNASIMLLNVRLSLTFFLFIEMVFWKKNIRKSQIAFIEQSVCGSSFPLLFYFFFFSFTGGEYQNQSSRSRYERNTFQLRRCEEFSVENAEYIYRKKKRYTFFSMISIQQLLLKRRVVHMLCLCLHLFLFCISQIQTYLFFVFYKKNRKEKYNKV